ncbi:MAG: hypothetical protein J5548_01040 [Prevotella sp.]|nr:hypothetical protein [Prevotella sp.]
MKKETLKKKVLKFLKLRGFKLEEEEDFVYFLFGEPRTFNIHRKRLPAFIESKAVMNKSTPFHPPKFG